MADEKTKKKVKTPTALKRDRQNEVKRIRNKSFRSKVSTAVKAFQTSEATQAPEKLSAIYSLMDKGVKKGVFKQNKADRVKSRMTSKLSAKA